jgi:hypothetical protein
LEVIVKDLKAFLRQADELGVLGEVVKALISHHPQRAIRILEQKKAQLKKQPKARYQ